MSVQLSSNTYTQHTKVCVRGVCMCDGDTYSVCVCLELLERASTSTVGMMWTCARVCTLSVDACVYVSCVYVCVQ